jgi:hypothetical protein
MEDVIEAAHIGRGVVDGVECEHLAFRNRETDWQIWIEVGAKPIPRKYVITSNRRRAAMHAADKVSERTCRSPPTPIVPPADAKKVELTALREIDEFPPAERPDDWRSDDPREQATPAHTGDRRGFVVLFATEKCRRPIRRPGDHADARIGRPLTPRLRRSGAAHRAPGRYAAQAQRRRRSGLRGLLRRRLLSSGCLRSRLHPLSVFVVESSLGRKELADAARTNGHREIAPGSYALRVGGRVPPDTARQDVINLLFD